MAEYMLKVGDIKFGLDGPAYKAFVHEIEANWAAQGRINRRPALQFVGVGAEKITLTGTIYGLFKNMGIGHLKQIESALLSPGPQMVMDGTGRRYGYFIIRSMREERGAFLTNGAPQKQEFTVNLERYGEDMLRDDSVMDAGAGGLGGLPTDGSMVPNS